MGKKVLPDKLLLMDVKHYCMILRRLAEAERSIIWETSGNIKGDVRKLKEWIETDCALLGIKDVCKDWFDDWNELDNYGLGDDFFD